ncbi:Mannosyl oligosaccharide glucosidase [Pelomyxa schiedti]|nr:Mannosyl oligosaccharide glucosidase [Pelomyxa schiedti]
MSSNAEWERLRTESARTPGGNDWKRWGPYLSDRQWGTVREDYSHDGDVWKYFPFEQAVCRAYRWGEDGLLGICDRKCRLCFSVALWNHHDHILKERLFGLTNSQGNHGEDVKELYFHIDATPTSSYLKASYKYPHSAFPYATLVAANKSRTRKEPEYEITDTSAFVDNSYFDVVVEYAKVSDNDLLMKITAKNMSNTQSASLDILPTLWFRNTWSWDCKHEGCTNRPLLTAVSTTSGSYIVAQHETLGKFHWFPTLSSASLVQPELLFTGNETNMHTLYGVPNKCGFTKDGINRRVIANESKACNERGIGTKCSAWFKFPSIPPQESGVVFLQLREAASGAVPITEEEAILIFEKRKQEADDFYASIIPSNLTTDEKMIYRKACAGLLWSKQFYHYSVPEWLTGDPAYPPPPPQRYAIRNSDWQHCFMNDIISMPDKWEYPWFALWDLAFHMVPMSKIDPFFAKQQLLLFTREWYMHPNGQLPAYEFNFSDVNPPVHAWSCLRVWESTGGTDFAFLERCFHKLLLNFTWWVNRKDPSGRNLFSGGFLGLDNVGLFDRSKPLPGGGSLEQADGTAWMGFFCGIMLRISLILATQHNIVYEDMASKFFEHFISIIDAINNIGGSGLWDTVDSFYYDQVMVHGVVKKIKCRSIVGLLPIIAVQIISKADQDLLPNFTRRMVWFLANRPNLAQHVARKCSTSGTCDLLLALVPLHRLSSLLQFMSAEDEFLSPYGLRSLSKSQVNIQCPICPIGTPHVVSYTPAESDSDMFGGNSNWRGPVWFPVNVLIVEALQLYGRFYQSSFLHSHPYPHGPKVTLEEISLDICRRLTSIMLLPPCSCPTKGTCTCHPVRPFSVSATPSTSSSPTAHTSSTNNTSLWTCDGQDCVVFYEYFCGDTGRGAGASHQTGWTALVASLLDCVAQHRP